MVLTGARSLVPSSTQSRSCRILCYGDSLTAGYYANGSRFSPYGDVLQESLRAMGIQCEVSICGLSGRRADQMVAEVDSQVCQPDIVGKRGKGLAHMLDREGPYDLVILMAGTNDFVPNVNLKTVRDSVCRLHNVCHTRGVPTVMLAAPCNVVEMRKGLGQLLKDWASRNPTKVLGFVDPEDIMPRSKVACWEPDQVHFTPAGSRTLGAHLSSIVAQILKRLGQTAHRQSAAIGHSSKSSAPTAKPQANVTLTGKQVLHRRAGQMAAPVLVAKSAVPRLFGGA